MNRLYRWLHARATSFHTGPPPGNTRRTLRTHVTVEEQHRTVMFTMPSASGDCLCPLCGHPVTPFPGNPAGAGAIESITPHAHCPEHEANNVEQDPRLKPGEIRRLL